MQASNKGNFASYNHHMEVCLYLVNGTWDKAAQLVPTSKEMRKWRREGRNCLYWRKGTLSYVILRWESKYPYSLLFKHKNNELEVSNQAM
jgi:hypothetical protein